MHDQAQGLNAGETEGFSQNLFDMSSIAMFVTHAGKILMANNAAGKMMLLPEGESLNGQQFSDLVHEEDRELIREQFVEMFPGKVSTIDLRLIRFSDEPISLRLTSWETKLGDNEVLISTALDRTDLEHTESELGRMYRLLNTVLDSIPESVAYLDLENKYKLVNRAFECEKGIHRAEIIGKHVDELLSENSATELKRMLTLVVEGESPVSFSRVFKDEHQQEHQQQVIMAPVLDSKGNVSGIVSANRDITEYESLRQEMASAERMIAFSTLTQGVGHEFGDLLTGIGGLIDLALAPNAEIKHIQEDLIRAKRLVKRALSVSTHISSLVERPSGEKKSENLKEVLEPILKFVSRMYGKEGLIIEFDLPENLPNIILDRMMVGQLFFSLLSVLRLSIEDVGGKITLSALNTSTEVAITLTSDQSRIPRPMLISFLQSFRVLSLEGAPDSESPKLRALSAGLRSAAELTRSMGGRLVSGDKKTGVQLTVSFSVDKETADDQLSTGEDTLKNKSILIVEDEEIVRHVATRMLSEVCSDVTDVNTVAGALAVLQKKPMDMILLDVLLPDGSSDNVLNYVNAMPKRTRPLVVIFTGLVNPIDTEHFISLGVSDIIYKQGDSIFNIGERLSNIYALSKKK